MLLSTPLGKLQQALLPLDLLAARTFCAIASSALDAAGSTTGSTVESGIGYRAKGSEWLI